MRLSILKLFALTLALGLQNFPAAAQGVAGNYLAGLVAANGKDYAASAQYYTKLLISNPNDPFVLENAILAQLSLGQTEKAIPIAYRLDALEEVESQLGNLAVVLDLASKENFAEVTKRIQSGQGIGPLVDGLLLAWSALGEGNMTAASAGFDTLAEEPGVRGFALYHKALALASVGNFGAAHKIYASEAGANLQASRRGALAHVQILSQLGRNQDGLAIIAALFGDDLDPELQALSEALAGDTRIAFSLAPSPKAGMAEVFYSIADALRGEADADFALLYTRSAEFLKADHIDALLLSAENLERLGQFELATASYEQVPASHPLFHAAEMGRAEAMRRDGRIEAATEVLRQLTRTHSELSIVHNTLGDLLRQQQEYQGAAEAYNTALDLMGDQSDSKWFTLYARGIAFERLGNWPRAEADFRAALDLRPEQPQVLNYLGYSLVEKRIKLDEALDMIERAVAARPDSGYIVDSLGWVLYRLGRFEEAVSHMERAAELMPVDPIVNDHLGDVYWMVGRKNEAHFQWRRALSFINEDSPPEADPERVRMKLDLGLDAVLESEAAMDVKVANDG